MNKWTKDVVVAVLCVCVIYLVARQFRPPPGPIEIPTAAWFAQNQTAREDTVKACRDEPDRMRDVQLACLNAERATEVVNSFN
ncbi:MAG: hypothetical protein ABSC06_23505 [Rhodopila sp.]|jgi:hypothetical protein